MRKLPRQHDHNMSTTLAPLITLLMPPSIFILTGCVGLALWRRRPRLARYLCAASFALLWILSTTAFNVPLLAALAWPAPASLQEANGARAIVVLGGGISKTPPEYFGATTVNARTLDRLRYAAWLHRQTELPILASGGRHDGVAESEAELMKGALENEFGTPVRWIEPDSRNTFENARKSARILHGAGVRKIYLVTDSNHMRRALQAFAPTGIEVIPAPINIFTRDPLGVGAFLPSPLGMSTSASIAHELVGRVWYTIKAAFER